MSDELADDPERIVRDLRALIDEAATNRDHRSAADGPEGLGLAPDGNTIAEKQHAIIQRGADRDSP